MIDLGAPSFLARFAARFSLSELCGLVLSLCFFLSLPLATCVRLKFEQSLSLRPIDGVCMKSQSVRELLNIQAYDQSLGTRFRSSTGLRLSPVHRHLLVHLSYTFFYRAWLTYACLRLFAVEQSRAPQQINWNNNMTDDEKQAMERYGITYETKMVFEFEGRKYSQLRDALNQAKKQLPEIESPPTNPSA